MTRLLVLLALGCSYDLPGESPSRYEYCATQVNSQPLTPEEHDRRFRECLEGPGARADVDGGSD